MKAKIISPSRHAHTRQRGESQEARISPRGIELKNSLGLKGEGRQELDEELTEGAPPSPPLEKLRRPSPPQLQLAPTALAAQ